MKNYLRKDGYLMWLKTRLYSAGISSISAIILFYIFCLFAVSNAMAAQPRDTVFDSHMLKTYSKQEHREWQFVKKYQMGVAGKDLFGHKIYCPPGERFFLHLDNWFPLSGRKETLCGRLDHFNYYIPPWIAFSHELDWNNYMIPDNAHSWLIDQPKNVYLKAGIDLSEWHTCGDNDCMEAEITPTGSFVNPPENFWFPKYLDDSPLEGMNICTYGAWVGDGSHNYRPEIHPSEMIWWKGEADGTGIAESDYERVKLLLSETGGDVYYLMVVMDDSDRLGSENNFDFDCGRPPAGWQPWASVPHDFGFRLAFSAPITGGLTIEPQQIVVQVLRQHNLTQGYGDMDDGDTHDLIIDGKKILEVRESGAGKEDIGVGFDFRKDTNGNNIEGYVTLSGRVNGDSYVVLRVLNIPGNAYFEWTGEIDDMRPIPIPPVIYPAFLDDECLRYDYSVAGLQLNCFKLKPENLEDASIQKIWFQDKDLRSKRKSLGFSIVDQETHPWIRVDGPVPVMDNLEFYIELDTGETISLDIPGIALDAQITDQRAVRTMPLEHSAWQQIVNAASQDRIVEMPSSVALEEVELWQFEITPAYTSLKNGTSMKEDESLIGEKLTEALQQNNPRKLSQLFGTTEPVDISWDFTAQEAVTGEPVPVRIVNVLPDTPSTSEVLVAVTDGHISKNTVNVMFPQTEDHRVFKLVADATLQDTLGKDARLEHTIYSHLVTAPSSPELADAIMTSIASVAGISESDLARKANLMSTDYDNSYVGIWVNDPEAAAAQAARVMAFQGSADRQFTIDELSRLFASAELCSSPPIADEDGDGIADFADLCPGKNDLFLDADCNNACITLDEQFNIQVPCFDLYENRFGFRFVYAGGLVFAVDLDSIGESSGSSECLTLNEDFSIYFPCFELNGIHFSVTFRYVGDIFWEVDMDSIKFID